MLEESSGGINKFLAWTGQFEKKFRSVSPDKNHPEANQPNVEGSFRHVSTVQSI
jgi:hypothetical protein